MPCDCQTRVNFHLRGERSLREGIARVTNPNSRQLSLLHLQILVANQSQWYVLPCRPRSRLGILHFSNAEMQFALRARGSKSQPPGTVANPVRIFLGDQAQQPDPEEPYVFDIYIHRDSSDENLRERWTPADSKEDTQRLTVFGRLPQGLATPGPNPLRPGTN